MKRKFSVIFLFALLFVFSTIFNLTTEALETTKDVSLIEMDVTSDGLIDIRDIAEISKHYNTKSEDNNWSSLCDINKDKIIDIYDLVIVSKTINTTLTSSVELNKSTAELMLGDTETLIATINPTNASNKDLIWTSSDEKIVTVDNMGKIIAISTGTATITVKTVDGSNEAKCIVTVNNNNNNNVAIFKDKNLENLIRSTINKPSGVLYKNDVNKITELNGISIGISDLAGIENLTSLEKIHLNENLISDITPLAELTNLTYADLGYTKINDITPLEGLTNLKHLDLTQTSITDIKALDGLTNLIELFLQYNQISDITPLEELTNLKTLLLSRNQLSDITKLNKLTKLEYLYLDTNKISDISSLKGLTNLIRLYLSNNQISDITALKRLTNLTALHLENTEISDADIEELKSILPNCNISSSVR